MGTNSVGDATLYLWKLPILPAELMDGYEVSKSVNNPQNDSPECIAAL
jgi:putative SOS response-associated peptidase YedK